MNRAELITIVAKKTGLKRKDADAAVKAMLEIIMQTLGEGRKVTILNFGTFEAHERKARIGTNPKTKAKIEIPASVTPAFQPGKRLKDAIKDK